MKIYSISANAILDSRGEETIEVKLRLENDLTVTASVPQGKSRGKAEAVCVPVAQAVRNIAEKIEPALRGMNVSSQKAIDDAMLKLDGTPDKSRLGANAMLGVSIACARATAAAMEMPFYEYLRRMYDIGNLKMAKPRLYVNLINGGMHAGNNLDFQEYLIIPKTANWKEAVKTAVAMHKTLGAFLMKKPKRFAVGLGDEGGYAPNFKDNAEPFAVLRQIAKKLGVEDKIDFGLDAAASNVKIGADKLFPMYKNLVKKYNLFYLEDPFAENSFKDFAKLNAEMGGKVLVTGDDLTTTNPERMTTAQAERSVNAVIIKPNQIGTLTETMEAVRLARKFGWSVIVSHRSGETNDDFIADFACGVGADGFKLGAPVRGERIAKYNRLLEMERQGG